MSSFGTRCKVEGVTHCLVLAQRSWSAGVQGARGEWVATTQAELINKTLIMCTSIQDLKKRTLPVPQNPNSPESRKFCKSTYEPENLECYSLQQGAEDGQGVVTLLLKWTVNRGTSTPRQETNQAVASATPAKAASNKGSAVMSVERIIFLFLKVESRRFCVVPVIVVQRVSSGKSRQIRRGIYK